jgi:acyl-CoA dehydrogenase
MIVFGQGAIRCHPYLRAELAALSEPDPGLALESFDRALFGHLGFIGTNLARSLWLGLTRGRFSACPLDGPERHYCQQVSRLSAAFALAADLSLLSLGPGLKRRERLSARLGDLLSQLYLLSATLKHYVDGGRQTAELPLLSWACEDSLARCREALLGLLRNLPLRPLAWMLRLAVFPSGLGYPGPDDHADHLAARLLQSPSPVRDRLSAGIFASRDPENPVGRLELALEAAQAAAPLERRLRTARRAGRIDARDTEAAIDQALPLGLLTPDEAETLRRSEALREQVIQVDSFDDLGARSRRPIGTHWRHRLRVITGRVRRSSLAQPLAPAPSNQETGP